jgi:lysophospholipase L1-like esterase
MRPSLKSFCRVLFAVIVIAGALTVHQTLRIWQYGPRAQYHVRPFDLQNPSAKLRILLVGDSTMVGIGALDSAQSTAGWFAQDLPKAHIDNFSVSGLRLKGLLKIFNPPPGEHYTLAVAQIGANDIIHFTPLASIREDLNLLIDRLKPIAGTVVIMHSGDVGLAPIFSWPASEILGWRSRQVRSIYMQTAKERGVLYVDLYADRSNDLFLKDIERYYGPDLFHPSGEGYQYWYHRICETLQAAGIELEDR